MKVRKLTPPTQGMELEVVAHKREKTSGLRLCHCDLVPGQIYQYGYYPDGMPMYCVWSNEGVGVVIGSGELIDEPYSNWAAPITEKYGKAKIELWVNEDEYE